MVKDKEEKAKYETDSKVVSTRVTIPVYEAINKVIKTGLYFRTSDYLRDIIIKDLKSREIEIGKKD